jgi:signal transduction histidine kinase
MKKTIIAVLGVFSILISCVGTATAMVIDGPHGTFVNGEYKDNFTVNIAHGNQNCVGSGTFFHYTYTSTTSGLHHYAFYADANDNPFLMMDHNGGYIPLNMTCGTSLGTGGPSFTPIGEFDATVDTQPPGVSITSPIGPVSTSANSYNVSGFVGDPENDPVTVKAMVNDVVGPTATVSGNTFSVTVPLSAGANNVQMIASDIVGHTATSNIVVITDTNSGGGNTGGGGQSGGASGPSGSTGSSGSTSSGSSNNSSASTTPLVKFNPEQVLNLTDPYANDKTTDPSAVQATAAIAGATGKTYDLLVLLILVLLALCLVVINRFRPIFAELDKDKSGLRKRIIVIVTLPSLLPLLGLGFLGYQQLSVSVKNSLSGQLEKAAQTSSLKLSREFSIRDLVVTKTSNDILQIQDQYQSQQQQLNQQKANCQQVVQANIPSDQFGKVTGNNDCLPFLTGFAQLASSSSAKVSDYLNALNEGATQASADLTAQENQRVNELLGSIRDFFPDVLEVDVVGANNPSSITAILPRTDSKQPTIMQTHKNLLPLAINSNVALLDTTGKTEQLYLTYPVSSGKTNLGGAVVALDIQDQNFVPSIWSTTPKPYAADQTYFVNTSGQLIMPESNTGLTSAQVTSLAKNASSSVYNLRLAKQVLATRTSPVSNTDWIVAVSAPASSILSPLAGIQRTALLAIAGFILLSLLLGIWFVSNIASEIEKLLQGAIAFAKGNLDFKIQLKSHDELEVLSDTMNQMATDIKAAQAALVEKDKEFINIATHELKAPMTSIIGNLSMITDDGMGQVDDTARKLVNQAYTGTVRLRDIVTDMLDVARIESGHAEFMVEPLSITDISKAVVEMNAVPAQQAGVHLAYQPSEVPNVLADKSKLQIILTNFVSNAIKYNKQGGAVTITHSVKDNMLVTAITDSGLGIPEDQQPHIFEKFYRVKHEDRANVPGTGLGMYITKQFIENMGGKVWFTSTHGQGTTFYFSLPTQTTPGTAAPTAV